MQGSLVKGDTRGIWGGRGVDCDGSVGAAIRGADPVEEIRLFRSKGSGT